MIDSLRLVAVQPWTYPAPLFLLFEPRVVVIHEPRARMTEPIILVLRFIVDAAVFDVRIVANVLSAVRASHLSSVASNVWIWCIYRLYLRVLGAGELLLAQKKNRGLKVAVLKKIMREGYPRIVSPGRRPSTLRSAARKC